MGGQPLEGTVAYGDLLQTNKPAPSLCVQDTSTRIWDLRKPSESVAVLCGNMGAVRSLRYSPDGRVLAAAEPADFVRLYDVQAGYSRYLPLLSARRGRLGMCYGASCLFHKQAATPGVTFSVRSQALHCSGGVSMSFCLSSGQGLSTWQIPSGPR